jgi:hypothetical protein
MPAPGAKTHTGGADVLRLASSLSAAHSVTNYGRGQVGMAPCICAPARQAVGSGQAWAACKITRSACHHSRTSVVFSLADACALRGRLAGSIFAKPGNTCA